MSHETDLVDMMHGVAPAVQQQDVMPLVTKTVTPAMSMEEFASWMSDNFGSNTLQQAMQQTAFLMCCDVIAQDMAKSTLELRERMANGTSRIVHPQEHEIAGLLALEPNRRHTWPEFIEMMALWGCFTSNAYAFVIRDNVDTIQEIIPLQTPRVFERVAGRDVFYDVTASTMQEQALFGFSTKQIPERDMIHVRARMMDGMDGYSTMQAGRSTLEAGKAIDAYRETLFSQEGQVRGVFQRDNAEPLPELAFTRLRSQLKVVMNRFAEQTEPIVLEGGLKFQAIASSAKDLELTQQFEAQINATCRLLRVPPHKIFHMSGAKYENLETQEKMYVGDTMVPVCERFEARYSKILLSRKDRLRFFFQHNREEMILKDTRLETERILGAVSRGLIEVDEARARLNWNPLPNKQGEVRLIPVNTSVVDRDGNVVIGATPGATEDPPEPGASGVDNKPKMAPERRVYLVP